MPPWKARTASRTVAFGELGGRQLAVPLEQVCDALGAEQLTPAAGLHQAVGEDAEHLPRGQLQARVVQFGLVEERQCRSEAADLLHGSRSAQDQGRRVAGQGEGDRHRRRPLVRRHQVAVNQGAVPFCVVLHQEPGVHLTQRRSRSRPGTGQRTHGVAGGRADGRGLRALPAAAMLNTAASLRLHASWDTETTSTVVVLRTLARRAHAMLKEARELQKAIVAINRGWRPELLEEFGVGPIVAATVLCAWSHPGRIHSEAAFAMLAGVAPIPANSGQVTTRYRLNRYGDRQLNNSLHTVVQSRIQYQPATRDYVARRTAEGKTNREIKRCLARYVARDLYRLLENTARTA